MCDSQSFMADDITRVIFDPSHPLNCFRLEINSSAMTFTYSFARTDLMRLRAATGKALRAQKQYDESKGNENE